MPALLYRWTWPPDKWQRLSTVARLAAPAAEVLDVGGRGRELARLLPGRVVSLNVEPPAEVVVAAGPLPYGDGAFEVVTSCDVLEHVAPTDREDHLGELLRVARERVVLCFPCGSEAKDAAERDLAERLHREFDLHLDFLDEHVALGLPRPADVAATLARLAPAARVEVLLDHALGDSDEVLLDAVRAWKRRDPRALARFAAAWLRRPPVALHPASDTPAPDSDRAYVVVTLPR